MKDLATIQLFWLEGSISRFPGDLHVAASGFLPGEPWEPLYGCHTVVSHSQPSAHPGLPSMVLHKGQWLSCLAILPGSICRGVYTLGPQTVLCGMCPVAGCSWEDGRLCPAYRVLPAPEEWYCHLMWSW